MLLELLACQSVRSYSYIFYLFGAEVSKLMKICTLAFFFGLSVLFGAYFQLPPALVPVSFEIEAIQQPYHDNLFAGFIYLQFSLPKLMNVLSFLEALSLTKIFCLFLLNAFRFIL